ncbi:MAG: hypothetical protein EHM65_00240 [Acidobacteriales bacterium]|nr:MAG: hypothetical protein EHM65_00240 [Terriglobales bacterium]
MPPEAIYHPADDVEFLNNMRHKIKNSYGEYTLGIGRDQYINPVKWSLYISPSHNDDVAFEKDFEGYKKIMNIHRKIIELSFTPNVRKFNFLLMDLNC